MGCVGSSLLPGPSLVAAGECYSSFWCDRFLIVVAPLVMEHGLWVWWPQSLRLKGSRAWTQHSGAQAYFLFSVWDLLGPLTEHCPLGWQADS